MEPIGAFVDIVRDAIRRDGRVAARLAFGASHPPVLVKRPADGFALPRQGADAKSPIGFMTEHIDLTAAPASIGPLASKWLVVRLQKREGSPIRDRISIGRATNCDAVVRFPFVSKLQAHILVGPGASLRYLDHGTANATRLNGRPFEGSQPIDLNDGDQLAIGPLVLELRTAEGFFDLLVAEHAAGGA